MNEEHLPRVSGKIASLVLEWCVRRHRMAIRLGEPARFYLDDLEWDVRQRSNVAPGSTSRVLRDLRSRMLLNYRVVSRSRSLYELTMTITEHPELPGIE